MTGLSDEVPEGGPEDEEDNGFESPQAQPVQGQFIPFLLSL